MAKRGRPRIRPDCDLAFAGEHFEKETHVTGRTRIHRKVKVTPTRVNGNGKPTFLCPKGYTPEHGFLTCRQAKLRGLCDE